MKMTFRAIQANHKKAVSKHENTIWPPKHKNTKKHKGFIIKFLNLKIFCVFVILWQKLFIRDGHLKNQNLNLY